MKLNSCDYFNKFISGSCRLILLPLVSLTFIWMHIANPAFVADDAFIHYRIADNFATSGYPFFNLAEPVLASSSMLWTLLLAFAFRIFGAHLVIVDLICAACSLAAAFTFAKVAVSLKDGKRWYIESLVFIVVLAALVSSSLQRMETPLAILLLAVAMYTMPKRPLLTVVALLLAVCTRLEMIVFLLPTAAALLFARRLSINILLFTALAVAGPILYGVWFFFADLVPQTVHAKAAIYNLGMLDSFFLLVGSALGKTIFLSNPLVLALACVVLPLSMLFITLGLWPLIRQERSRIAGLLLFGALSLMSLYVAARVYIFPWYTPLFLTPLLVGMALAAMQTKNIYWRALSFIWVAPLLVHACLDTFAALAQPESFSEYEGGQRAAAYRQLGEQIFKECPSCVLMASEIGGLGIGFRGKMLDAAGLATPEAVDYQRALIAGSLNTFGGGVPGEFVAKAKPDFVVGMDAMLEDFQRHSCWHEYEQIALSSVHTDREGELKAFRIIRATN